MLKRLWLSSLVLAVVSAIVTNKENAIQILKLGKLIPKYKSKQDIQLFNIEKSPKTIPNGIQRPSI